MEKKEALKQIADLASKHLEPLRFIYDDDDTSLVRRFPNCRLSPGIAFYDHRSFFEFTSVICIR